VALTDGVEKRLAYAGAVAALVRAIREDNE